MYRFAIEMSNGVVIFLAIAGKFASQGSWVESGAFTISVRPLSIGLGLAIETIREERLIDRSQASRRGSRIRVSGNPVSEPPVGECVRRPYDCATLLPTVGRHRFVSTYVRCRSSDH